MLLLLLLLKPQNTLKIKYRGFLVQGTLTRHPMEATEWSTEKTAGHQQTNYRLNSIEVRSVAAPTALKQKVCVCLVPVKKCVRSFFLNKCKSYF